jgi:hypothetical protein
MVTNDKKIIKRFLFVFSVMVLLALTAGFSVDLIGSKRQSHTVFSAVSPDGYFNYVGASTITIQSLTASGETWVQSGGGVFNIPATINGNPVTIIAPSAFLNSTVINWAVLPDSVTTVGASAFQNCSGLTSVTLGAGVKYINANAFKGCIGLGSVEFPANLMTIGDYAFSGCVGLDGITISNKVTSIGDYAFENCTGAQSLTIGTNVSSIGDYAFCGLVNVAEVNYNATNAGDLGGEWNGGTPFSYEGENSDLGENVDTVDFYIGNNVTHIGTNTFNRCVWIKSITFPANLLSIGNCAFLACTGLYEITIPDKVTTIGSDAFFGCINVMTVTIGTNVTSIGYGTFSGLENVAEVNYNATNVEDFGDQVFQSLGYFIGIVEFNIGNNVTRIPDNFLSPENGVPVRALTISSNVTSIGYNAFALMEEIISITLLRTTSVIALEAAYGAYSHYGNDIFSPYYNTLSAIYVPSSLVNAYKTAAGWSAYASIIYALTVDAQTPQVSVTQPAPNAFFVGDFVSLTVTASVDDGGALSYQWYKNTTNSNVGGTLIEGATDATYNPAETPSEGIVTYYYYYVVVTNTNESVDGNTTVSAVSSPIEIIVVHNTGSGSGNKGEDGNGNGSGNNNGSGDSNSQTTVIIIACAAVVSLAVIAAGFVSYLILRRKQN